MGLSCLAYPNNNPCPRARLTASPQGLRVVIARKKGMMALRIMATVIGCVPPEADHETRLQAEGIYLAGDPRKHQQESGKVIKGKDASAVYINEQVHATGSWSSFLLKTSLRQHRTCVRAVPSRGKEAGAFVTDYPPSLAERSSQGQSLPSTSRSSHVWIKHLPQAEPLMLVIRSPPVLGHGECPGLRTGSATLPQCLSQYLQGTQYIL